MKVNQLYHTWLGQVRQVWPQERVTRLRILSWLLVGIYESHSVHLARVAGKIPGLTRLVSRTRRLERFLDNPAVRVREWYAPIAQGWLRYLADTVGELHLVVDGSKIGFGHQLLLIAVAYRRRVIPLVWTWVPYVKGHSSAHTQRALLVYLQRLLPVGVPVTLVGDSEFGSVEVLKQLDAWHWTYVLRQKSNHHVRLTAQGPWQDFGHLIQHAGQTLWLGRGWLTEQSAYRVSLLAHWRAGEQEPWLLATNLPTRSDALKAYRRRMWVEETFGDLKKHGFDLESTHLRHFLHLSRLTLAVALLYVWLLTVGTRAIKRGQRHWVDRRERRDLSLFQIGWRIIERQQTNGLLISMSLCLV
jgi:hypothetical protein